MKGNYQEQEALIKFTPEAAGMSDAYQIQHYDTPSAHYQTGEAEFDYSLVSDFNITDDGL